MALQDCEVTQGHDESATAHQAQIRQVIAEEDRTGPVRPTQRNGGRAPSTAARLAVIATPRKRQELAPHGRVDALVPLRRLRAVLTALGQGGQTQITFEGLRGSCLSALETGDGEAWFSGWYTSGATLTSPRTPIK